MGVRVFRRSWPVLFPQANVCLGTKKDKTMLDWLCILIHASKRALHSRQDGNREETTLIGSKRDGHVSV